ncbi:MAG: diphosphate--fructose-6-phosphate 1-phosphotransferase [Nitrospinota bacterium]
MENKRIGILVGGGPAPGINSVIRAAAIKLINHGCEVFGIYDGFSHLMHERIDKVRKLSIDEVSLIHFQGGSILATSRANPTKDEKYLKNIVKSLERLKISCLITIGGDDTCFSAHNVAKTAGGKIQVVHVPKTIDNDLDLPRDIKTFGFASARDFGVKIVRSIMNDAATTKRWYFIIAMGRKAGHLALGIGRASGAHTTIIPEECDSELIDFSWLVDSLVAIIIKRKAIGRDYGVAILAEGMAEKLSKAELETMGSLEYDEHGHPRLSEIDLGKVVKSKVKAELEKLGVSSTIVDKDIGYELRCVEPVPFDLEYTKELGFSAAKHTLSGGSGDMVTIQEGRFAPMPFYSIMDPKTGKTKVRLVDVHTEAYEMALEYMVRLKAEDLKNSQLLKKMAAVANMSETDFVARFSRVATSFTSTTIANNYKIPPPINT